MKTTKPTAGPWTLGVENNACCEVLLGTEHNLTCNFDRRDNNTCAEVISREEMLANAFLVIEAGTVFHNTGLSPVQLLDLLKAIIAAADSELAQGGEMWFAEAVAPPIDDARAALAKCEGVGNG